MAQQSKAPASAWRPSAERGARVTILAALIGVLLVFGLAGAVVLQERQRDLRTARQDMLTLATVLADQTARTLQSVELVVSDVSRALVQDGLASPEEFRERAAGLAMHELLVARANALPQLDAVTLVGADGRLLNYSRGYPVPAINLGDRDYFTAVRDGPADRLLVSEPVQNRGSGTPTVYLVTRVSTEEGGFAGLVLGAMQLQYFSSFYAGLHLSPGTVVTLRRSDGVLLVRHPDASVNPPTDLTVLAAGERRIEEVVEHPGGPRMLAARIRLPHNNVVLSVLRPLDEVLEDFRADAVIVLASAALFAAALLCMAWLLVRRFRSLGALEQATTARQTAEQNLRDAENRLLQSQKMEALGQLAGGVAHDFNNVLQAVAGGARLIQKRPDDHAGVARLAGMVAEAADRGASVTRRLLAFARQDRLEAVPIEPAVLLANIAEVLTHTLGSGITVRLSQGRDVPPLLADKGQLEVVLVNLAINARDAMPQGGVLTLSAAAERVPSGRPELAAGDYVRLSLADTGLGMDAETLDRATEPFFTTKPVGRGTGLGLAMARGFAEQSGGALEIRSVPGEGTRVTLWLPRAVAAAVAPSAASPPPRKAAPRVLLVEDEGLVRATLAAELAARAWIVHTCADGAAALDWLAGGAACDLLVTDLAMDAMDGWALIGEARKLRPGLPALLVTGYLNEGEAGAKAGAAAREGPLDILRKPVSPDELMRRGGAVIAAAEAAPPVRALDS